MSAPAQDGVAPVPVSLRQALRFWLWLGCVSFGGPAGQIALMHTELVERRRWIGEKRFLHALNFCMVLPGPEAQQLATYMGWLLHGVRGGVLAGLLFVLPSLVLLIGLSWVYVSWGQTPWVAGIFHGIKPAVTALVLHAAWRIGSRTLRGPAPWVIAGAAFVAIFALGVPFPAIILAAALVGAVGHARWPAAFAAARAGHAPTATAAPATGPRALIDDDAPPPAHARFSRRRLARAVGIGLALWCAALAPLVLVWGADGLLTRMGLFFTQAALLTFGGAYAVLPYVFQAAVGEHGWLTAPQMIDGLALGETTPGPLIMVVAFIGYLGGWGQGVPGIAAAPLAGALAACVATFFTFLPSFVFILAGAPWIESTHGQARLAAPLQAITAAVVGVILNLALFFAWHTLWPRGFAGPFDVASAALALGALIALWRGVGVMPLLAVCAAAGLALRFAGLAPV